MQRRPRTTGRGSRRPASPAHFPCTSFQASSWSLLYRRWAGNAVTNRVDAVAAPRTLIVILVVDHVDVGDAAQRQRQRAALVRAGEGFGLLGLQLEGDGLAYDGVLALFFLRSLINRENADVVEDDLGVDVFSRSGAVRILVALRKYDVDPVVGQDEATGTGFGRNLGGNGSHAARQDRGHETRPVGLDQLGLANRLARDERRTRDRAHDLVGRVRVFAAANEIVADRRCRPGLPLQVFGLDRLAEADLGLRHQDVGRRQLRDRHGRGRLVRAAGEICGNAAGADGDGQDDNACGIHYASLSTLRRDASVAVTGVDQLFVKAWLMRRI